MKFLKLVALAALLLTLMSAAFAGGVQSPPKMGYTVIDLGNQVPAYSDGTLATSRAVAINDGGEVVVDSENGSYAFLNGTMKSVSFMGSSGYVLKVNGIGQVLGLSFTQSGAATYIQDAANSASLYSDFFGSGVNDSGDIAGSVMSDSGSLAAIASNGKVTTYPALDATGLSDFGLGLDSQAIDINNAGISIGTYSLYATDGSWWYSAAWIARGDIFLELDGLGGDYTGPTDINNGSFVVGGATNGNGDYHAFLWSPRSRRSIDLGTLGGFSNAAAINDLNQVVGQSGIGDIESNIMHGFLWKSGRMTDLNSLIDPRLGVTIVGASGINRSGQIAATIVTAQGNYHAALLTPLAKTRLPRHGTALRAY